MKKTVLIVLILVMLINIGGCYKIKYMGWKEVDIKGYDNIMIPKDWLYSQNNGYTYLTDRPIEENGCNVYFVETVWEPLPNEDGNKISINDYYGEIILIDYIKSAVLSSGVFLGEYRCMINGVEDSCLYILFTDNEAGELEIITFNKEITYNLLEKIAMSYKTRILNW